jgi:hypothetical protein
MDILVTFGIRQFEVYGVMIGSAINVMKVDNNFLPLLVDHGVSTLRN